MTNHSLPAVATESSKIAIIGGGLTGLFTATLLERAFAQNIAQDSAQTPLPQINVFEKSRSVGRLATRYRTDSHTGKNWQKLAMGIWGTVFYGQDGKF